MNHPDDKVQGDGLDQYIAERLARDPEFAREYDALESEYRRKNQRVSKEIARRKGRNRREQEEER